MKAKILKEVEVEITTLEVSAGVRYWEDSTVNGIEDEEGSLVPCRNGDNWCPIIDIDNGVIINWEKGKTADIHYKVCDDGTYTIKDKNGEEVKKYDGYVPKIMCPAGGGYGDYIIMKIDSEGKINNFVPFINDFFED